MSQQGTICLAVLEMMRNKAFPVNICENSLSLSFEKKNKYDMWLTLISKLQKRKCLSKIVHGLTGMIGLGRNTLAVENIFTFIINKYLLLIF